MNPCLPVYFCGLLLLGLYFSGCNETKNLSEEPSLVTPIAVAAESKTESEATSGTPSGKTLFAENCATCHGSHGQGNPIMMNKELIRLDDAAFLKTLTDEQIETTIREGRGMMPAFETTFNPAELDALVKYIRTLPQEKASG
jgi:mono/diheme cytochrome c family protein